MYLIGGDAKGEIQDRIYTLSDSQGFMKHVPDSSGESNGNDFGDRPFWAPVLSLWYTMNLDKLFGFLQIKQRI